MAETQLAQISYEEIMSVSPYLWVNDLEGHSRSAEMARFDPGSISLDISSVIAILQWLRDCLWLWAVLQFRYDCWKYRQHCAFRFVCKHCV